MALHNIALNTREEEQLKYIQDKIIEANGRKYGTVVDLFRFALNFKYAEYKQSEAQNEGDNNQNSGI